jgi:hypothetical protein
MPRYFFHVDDGFSVPDSIGAELPDLDAARAEAVKAAGSILKDFDGDFWARGKPWLMSVTDEQGLLQFALRFSAMVPSGPVTFLPGEG